MREYFVYTGSNIFFNTNVYEHIKDEPNVSYFLELVKINDDLKVKGQTFNSFADILIVPNHNYHGIVETAHDRLGPLIEELTTNDCKIFIHNPPRTLIEYLQKQKENDVIRLQVNNQKYIINYNGNEFANSMINISQNIIGQSIAIEEISKSMWYLSNVKRKKPYVIMLYGNSSLGKTELVKEIAANFYDGKFYEKHLSMFKNQNYSDYFFGEKPNRKSLGYELLERESNLVFFDELDKCPEYFFSAFYTLFDNIIFKDATYDANIEGLFIVATSNYKSPEEIRENLGLPIFYRIDKFIPFLDFDVKTIYDITMKEILLREDEYKDKIESDEIYKKVSPLIKSSDENARTIKQKVQKVIEELLFLEVKNKIDFKKG